LARSLATAFDAKFFELLMTRHTLPEEVLGPISLRGLENDKFERVTIGKLPEAELVFLDETMKANSAVLNALLGILNERRFHNGGAVLNCPLRSLIGASNELGDHDLLALRDRFILTFELRPVVRDASFRKVVTGPEPIVKTRLSMKTLEQASWATSQIRIPDPVVDALLAVREACRVEGLSMSDRRWKRALRLVKASAYMAAEKAATVEDLMILTDVVWFDPKDRPKAARLVGAVADPVGSQAIEIVDAGRELAAKVSALRTGTDRKKYVADAAGALDQFTAQEKKLASLAKSAGRRAKASIAAATREIAELRDDLARALSVGLGIGTAGGGA
jgi:MoxR-like ATPase